ncbi:hypothetical protein PILCRDRAFT_825768 [Piloderma croceum F 1598]|uniref:J domain-containing protein n=1 Tax=Piloderma croceum (strain F 1598) TaxID=765440 RepID=A0A0C3FAX0_PILCF|nr:hypothetical protein PILCRDRAFT_825768 [Piloderma croceum F 1598]
MTAHPDKGGSEAKMAAVNEAYEVLSNPGTAIMHCIKCKLISPFFFSRFETPLRRRRRP